MQNNGRIIQKEYYVISLLRVTTLNHGIYKGIRVSLLETISLGRVKMVIWCSSQGITLISIFIGYTAISVTFRGWTFKLRLSTQ